MPRDVLEAARTDGATEWQVFRRVTVPLLAPVLTVVFITMIINVLKVFDIVFALAPGVDASDTRTSSRFAMWQTAFRAAGTSASARRSPSSSSCSSSRCSLLNIRRFRRDALDVAAAAPAVEVRFRSRTSGPRPRSCARSAAGPLQIVLVVIGLLWLVPTVGLFITSILPASDARVERLVADLLAAEPSPPSSNYNALFHNSGLMTALKTTAYIAVGNTLLVVFVGAMAGYAFAWLDFPGRDWLFIGVIALLVVPIQMALIPMFRLYDTLGLFDTWYGIALFHTAFGLPFAIFLLRNFFIGLPKDILESARIDGASEIRIFLRLILPLGLPAIASLAIFQFLWTWNDLLVALTFGQNTTPITVWISGQLREFGSSLDIIAPASFISLLDPAGRLLRLPALLRAGAAGRLGEVMAEVAVVGSGLAGFTAYQTLRRRSRARTRSPSSERTPTRRRRGGVRAAAIRQRAMRSESDGHCRPTTFPGLALRAAARQALAEAARSRRSPTATTRRVEEFLAHVERTRERSGWERSLRPRRVGAGASRTTAVSSSTGTALPARPARTRSSWPERPRRAARRSARRSTRTSRTSTRRP